MNTQEQMSQSYKSSLDPQNIFLVFLAMNILRCQEGDISNLSNNDIAHTIEEQLMVARKDVPSTGEISDIRYMIDHEEIEVLMIVR